MRARECPRARMIPVSLDTAESLRLDLPFQVCRWKSHSDGCVRGPCRQLHFKWLLTSFFSKQKRRKKRKKKNEVKVLVFCPPPKASGKPNISQADAQMPLEIPL